MGHYHGISLRIHMKEANQALTDFIKGVNIDVYTIRDSSFRGAALYYKRNEIIHHISRKLSKYRGIAAANTTRSRYWKSCFS